MGKLYIKGIANFDVEPDTATIAVLVEGKNYDYAACAESINLRTLAARQMLEEGGVATELIRSHDYRIEKIREWDRKDYPGMRFIGKHDLRITLPLDRDQINRLLGGLMSADAALEVSLGYEVRDLSVHRDKAEELSVSDALRRAKIIAEAAGCRVIGVRSIHAGEMMSEQHSTHGYDYSASYSVSSEEPPMPTVAPKMLGVSASVSVCLDIAAHNTQ